MFIPKDTRKVLEILYAENEDRTKLKLGRREAEFNGDTRLVTAPERLTTLTSTKYLSLYGNKLNKLSYFKTLANHHTLEDINLGYNELTELPSSLGDILSLKRVWLEDNHLGPMFPAPLLKLHHLTTLTLSGNIIQELPETISNLSQLEELSIASNHLVSLPYGIGSLTKLRTLVLRGNQIKRLPSTMFTQLISLESLSLNSNQLRTIPSSIGNCTNLTTVYLNSNQLKFLPSALSRCTKLKKLNIANNEICFLPLTIISAWAHKLDPVIVKAAVVLIQQYLRDHPTNFDSSLVIPSSSSSSSSSSPDNLSYLATYGSASSQSTVESPSTVNLSSSSSSSAKYDETYDTIVPDDISLAVHYRTRKSDSSSTDETGSTLRSTIDNSNNTTTTTTETVLLTPAKTLSSALSHSEITEEFIPDDTLRVASLQDLNLNENPIFRLAFGPDYDEGFRPSQYRTPLVDEIRKRTKKV